MVTIDKTSMIGTGSYGAVYLAQYNELKCAAKVIHSTLFMFNIPGKPNVAEQFEKECLVISRFRHPNIVQFLGTFRDPDTLFPVLLMELMERNLTALLEESTEPLPYGKQISICHDVSLAITYLHSVGFIHRDISSNNVLMKGSAAKLTDLGVSVLMDSDVTSRLTTCPGTEVYMPPDSVRERPDYTEKIDCFSFGVLGVQILTRRFPQPGRRHCEVTTLSGRVSSSEVVRVVPELERRRGHLDMISATHPLLELLRKCLKDKESDRPSSVDICRYIGRLRKIEEVEAQLRCRANAATNEECSLDRIAEEEVQQLKASLESCHSQIERLTNETELQREEISRLEREKAELVQTPSNPSQQVHMLIPHLVCYRDKKDHQNIERTTPLKGLDFVERL